MGICCSKQKKHALYSDQTPSTQVQTPQVLPTQQKIEALIRSVNSKNITANRISQNIAQDIQNYKGKQVQNSTSEPTYLLILQDFDSEGLQQKCDNNPVAPWVRVGLNAKSREADEWTVAFHGFKNPEYVLPKILNEGLRQGPGQGYHNEVGSGIYCSPEIAIAESYSGIIEIEGLYFKTVMQCRVQPSKIKKCSPPGIWVINDSKDIRPYGIYFKQVQSTGEPLTLT